MSTRPTVILRIDEAGQAKGYDSYGCMTRKFGSGRAVNAIIQSDLAIVTYKDNSIKSYDLKTGIYIRTLKH